jgi:hypothetical protein
MTGNGLYERMLGFDYQGGDMADLMHKVWSPTPFMTECHTGAVASDDWLAMRDWCRARWGDMAWPIHGRAGRWQDGSATVFGWTFFGFETAEMLAEFEAEWECRSKDPPGHRQPDAPALATWRRRLISGDDHAPRRRLPEPRCLDSISPAAVSPARARRLRVATGAGGHPGAADGQDDQPRRADGVDGGGEADARRQPALRRADAAARRGLARAHAAAAGWCGCSKSGAAAEADRVRRGSMKIVTWFRSLFAWRAVRSTGVWVYAENTVTRRRAAYWRGNYSPLDRDFIRTGDIVHGPRGTYVVGEQSEIWVG